ncbi:MAG TPA: class I SAM-dependent methyltransferase [Stellaceae bacterium]|nr:class I SAM-dependent methyltransferase [Stellaceae bacterium]
MSATADWLLSHLLDFAMRNRALDDYRRAALAAAHGVVLEIGVGSGLNLPLYAGAVRRVVALDPSPALLRLARSRVKEAPVPVSLVQGSAERLPFPEATFDSLVMTWTLCSIDDPRSALIEMRRVLKPDGRLLFVEHGLSPDARVARWQRRLTPCWSRLSGGCHLDRKADDLIRAAGFRLDKVETGYMRGPKPWTFLYRGAASGGSRGRGAG